MASGYRFYVGRNGASPQECIAHLPVESDPAELLDYLGGEVTVVTPRGEVRVKLPSSLDMLMKQIDILLQHGVRDFVFPPASDGESKASPRKKSGFVSKVA